jgi:hypothetical protein
LNIGQDTRKRLNPWRFSPMTPFSVRPAAGRSLISVGCGHGRGAELFPGKKIIDCAATAGSASQKPAYSHSRITRRVKARLLEELP